MFNFSLKQTAIFRALRWAMSPGFRFAKQFKIIFFLLSIFSGLAIIWFPVSILRDVAFVSLIFGGWFFVLFFILDIFFNSKLKFPKLTATVSQVVTEPQKFNIAGLLSLESARSVYKCLKFAGSNDLFPIDSSLLFYFILKENPQLKFIFSRAVLDFKQIKQHLKQKLKQLKKGAATNLLYSKEFEDCIIDSLKIAQLRKHQRIEPQDILVGLAEHDTTFKKILMDAELKAQDIKNISQWQESLQRKARRQKKFWLYENLVKKGTLGKDWAAGFALTLEKYSTNWTEQIKNQGFREIIGHKDELQQVETILSSPEIDNVLLVGRPGTGRRSIIQALAMKAFLGMSTIAVNYKKVIELNMASLVAQLETKEEEEAILDKIFQDVKESGDIILVINNIHDFMGEARPGAINIAGILSSYLPSPQFQVVAITSFSGLHKHIEQNPPFLALFKKVEVSETSPQETLLLLQQRALSLEKKYKTKISYPAMRDIVSLSSRYMPNDPFPQKAIDILNTALAYVSQSAQGKWVLPSHIAKVVSEKIETPVGKVAQKEKEVLLNLENLLHKRIIDQEIAVKNVSLALRRARTAVETRNAPMGSFLFLGPTGVGKTETAKALAETYFGSESKMIRLDMSEFQAQDIPRLIGSVDTEGLLTTPVRENPFSLILLDEIEKTHPNILNLFLQVLDEGHLTDGLGRKVDFRNSIIIATSNAGYKIILQAIKENLHFSGIKQKLLDYLFSKDIFRPEFINRFDAVVIFRPLTKENLLDIAQLILARLKKNLAKKDIEFIITQELKEKIVELSYNPVFGAREMRRVVQSKVEDVVATALLRGELKRGAKIEIDPENFKMVFRR